MQDSIPSKRMKNQSNILPAKYSNGIQAIFQNIVRMKMMKINKSMIQINYHFRFILFFILRLCKYTQFYFGNLYYLMSILSLNITESLLKSLSKEEKKALKRQNILQEWIGTEKSYLLVLRIILQKIQPTLLNANIFTSEEFKKIFKLEPLVQFSQQIIQEMTSISESFDPQTTLISQFFLKICPFFKIYTSYCKDYHAGTSILKKYKNHQVIINLQKHLPLDLQSYFMSPIQRPPRHLLFMKAYKEALEQTHKDYQNICLAVEKFDQMNRFNNEAIERQSHNAKMFQLASIYPNLLTKNRQLIKQVILQGFNQPLLYVFNNLLMIVIEQEQEGKQIKKLEGLIQLGSSSFCNVKPNKKYNQNILYACGIRQSIHLKLKCKQDIKMLSQCLEEIFQQLRKVRMTKVLLIKSNDNIKFQAIVQGSDKRWNGTTIYKVKFRLPSPYHIIEYHEYTLDILQNLRKKVKQYYKISRVPSIQPKESLQIYDNAKNGSKIIEYRQMSIQILLNFLFRRREIIQDPEPLLSKLKINQEIWKFTKQPHRNEKDCCSICYDSQPITIDDFIAQRYKFLHNEKMPRCIHKYIRDTTQLLNLENSQYDTFEKKLLWLWLKEGRIDYCRLNRYRESIGYIEINLYNLHMESIIVDIDQQSTFGDVFNVLCKKLNLIYMNDFAIVQITSSRLFDSDQSIYEYALQADIIEKKQKGFFQSLKSISNSKLYFKKILFLSQEEQEESFRSDPHRLPLIVGQILRGIKEQTICCKYQRLINVVSYYLFWIDAIDYKDTPPKQKIQNLVPKSLHKYTLQSTKWNQAVHSKIQQQRINIKTSNNKNYYLLNLIYQEIKNQRDYHSQTYKVSLTNQDRFIQKIKLDVNYKKLTAFNETTKVLLFEIPIQQVDYTVTHKLIFVNHMNQRFRFDGANLWNLKAIIQKYKILDRIKESN